MTSCLSFRLSFRTVVAVVYPKHGVLVLVEAVVYTTVICTKYILPLLPVLARAEERGNRVTSPCSASKY